jgi:hypothetical protein
MAEQWLENVATAAFTVFAVSLFVIALRAWWFTKSPRVALLTAGFGLMVVKGLTLSIALFLAVDWAEVVLVPSILLDLGVLAMFYLAVLKRSS